MTAALVRTPSLHDAELKAVAVDHVALIARLDFRLEDGALHYAELRGLKAFRCEDLTLQNVVNRVLQSSRGMFSSKELEDWIGWVTSLSESTSWLSQQRMQEWLSACAKGTLDVIVFEPSAGAQVVAVCEQLVVQRSAL